MKKIYLLIIINLTFCLPKVVLAQTTTDTIVTLKQCIGFALRNQPAVRQAAIDQEINERDIRIGLSGWLPQLSSSDEYLHYFKGSPVTSTTLGVVSPIDEYSSLGLQASQVLYNNDVLLAAKTAKYSRLYYKQNTVSSQINVVSDVSKAFFDVLLSQKDPSPPQTPPPASSGTTGCLRNPKPVRGRRRKGAKTLAPLAVSAAAA